MCYMKFNFKFGVNIRPPININIYISVYNKQNSCQIYDLLKCVQLFTIYLFNFTDGSFVQC